MEIDQALIKKVNAYMFGRVMRCDVCGHTEKLLVGSLYKKSLKLAVRCDKHSKQLRQVFVRAFETPIPKLARDLRRESGTPEGTNIILNIQNSPSDDSKWFEANPTRTHRLRTATEYDDDTGVYGGNTVIVTQIRPGHRSRRRFDQLGMLPDDDDVLSAMCTLLDENPGEAVRVKDAITRAILLKSVGGSA